MRILQVAPPWLTVPPLRYGGIEWVVSGLADGLVDAGHQVTLLAAGGSRTRAQLETVLQSHRLRSSGTHRSRPSRSSPPTAAYATLTSSTITPQRWVLLWEQ